jgi:hypothetical protein
MTRKTSKTATHRHVANCTVKFSNVKHKFGGDMIRVVFSNGEVTTLSAKRFNELFTVN